MIFAVRSRFATGRRLLLGLLVATAFAGFALGLESRAVPPPSPSVLFQKLYADVQTQSVFLDSKTFADAVPKQPPALILASYRAHSPRTKAELLAFIGARFDVPVDDTLSSPPTAISSGASLKAHINALWPLLTRPPVRPASYSSQLPLNQPFVVPGGRFRELYYWDSYFTMLGLIRDRRREAVVRMTDNFADFIERYGHIPNGARTYYLSRSQPPFFFLMVGLTSSERTGAHVKYLSALRREYAFWMHGAERLQPGQSFEHVVALPNGTILNRYWDALDTPRDESYREDVALAASVKRPAAELYRDIGAAAESGWDFSSRWLADGRSLATIETTAIVPVDLNSLLFGLEQAIADGCGRIRDDGCVAEFLRRAAERQAAMNRYLWDVRSGQFLDYHWRNDKLLDRPSAAMLYPLFVGLAGHEQAKVVATAIRGHLLAAGGLVSTTQRTGQQWDAPNGWAPLQWIAVSGLNDYGERDLAREIAARWLRTISKTYCKTGKLLEKYDVEISRPGGGGEYPLQDGFGWTNGVVRELMDLYPDIATEVDGQGCRDRQVGDLALGTL